MQHVTHFVRETQPGLSSYEADAGRSMNRVVRTERSLLRPRPRSLRSVFGEPLIDEPLHVRGRQAGLVAQNVDGHGELPSVGLRFAGLGSGLAQMQQRPEAPQNRSTKWSSLHRNCSRTGEETGEEESRTTKKSAAERWETEVPYLINREWTAKADAKNTFLFRNVSKRVIERPCSCRLSPRVSRTTGNRVEMESSGSWTARPGFKACACFQSHPIAARPLPLGDVGHRPTERVESRELTELRKWRRLGGTRLSGGVGSPSTFSSQLAILGRVAAKNRVLDLNQDATYFAACGFTVSTGGGSNLRSSWPFSSFQSRRTLSWPPASASLPSGVVATAYMKSPPPP